MNKPLLVVALLLLLALPARGQDSVASDPRAWIVPESKREQARQLVDPGPSGLPGKLLLEELELGHRMIATYRGEPGELVLYVAPAKAAPDDAVWSGERLAVGVVSSTVPESLRDRAADRMGELLGTREGGWSWHRVPPDREARAEAAGEARSLAREALRAAWLRDRPAVVAKTKEARRLAPRDLPALLTSSRALYRAGAAETGRQAGREAYGRATKGVAAAGDDERGDRMRVVAASAAALAGDADAARNLARAVLDNGRLSCELDGAVRDLELAGSPDQAAALAARVADREPGCDEVAAAHVDVLRRLDRLDEARRVAEAGLGGSSASTPLRSALARVELSADRPAEAVTPARVAVLRGGARGRSAPTLAAVAATGAADERTLEDWDGRAATRPDHPGAVAIGAVSCLQREDFRCAAERLERAIDLAAPDAWGLQALRALAEVALGDAEDAAQALEAAWEEPRPGPEAVAAEARLAGLRGDEALEEKAWSAYLEAWAWEPGPVPEADARALLAELRGEGAGAESGTPSEPEPTGEPEDDGGGFPLWLWFVLGLMLAAVAVAWRRRG